MMKVELTEEEAELFRDFRKHQREFEVMKEHGVFDFSHGMVILHRDGDGNLRQIETKKVLYRYTKKTD